MVRTYSPAVPDFVRPPRVLGLKVSPTSHDEAMSLIDDWIDQPEGRYICCANVHMVMEGHDDESFKKLVNQADLVTPDGMPLVWYLRKHGYPSQTRVTGPELMVRVLEEADAKSWKVGLLGGEPETLSLFKTKLANEYPELQLAFCYSPPFRESTADEDEQICESIRASGVDVLLVGLGCPKQERWMAAHRGKLNCVMLGVGAAFQFYTGQIKHAPEWVQRSGAEWLFRLCMEPRRLWRRYAKHNPRFIWLILAEQVGIRQETTLPRPTSDDSKA